MQYLGKLKRHLFRFAIAGEELPALGTQLFSEQQRNAIGEVIAAAYNPEQAQVEVLAIALEEAALEGKVLLESVTGASLALLELPYSNDPEAEIKR